MTSILNSPRRMGTVAAVDGASLRLTSFSPLLVQNDDQYEFVLFYFFGKFDWSCKCRAFQESRALNLAPDLNLVMQISICVKNLGYQT